MKIYLVGCLEQLVDVQSSPVQSLFVETSGQTLKIHADRMIRTMLLSTLTDMGSTLKTLDFFFFSSGAAVKVEH